MDYESDFRVLNLGYTATCLIDREAKLSLNIFPN